MAPTAEGRLAALKAEAQREWQRARAAGSPRGPRRSLAAVLARGVGLALLLVVLPFAVLVRTAVYLYQRHDLPTWLALAGGAAVTVGVVTACGAWASRRLTGRARAALVARWVALPLVVGWCGYALIHLAGLNAKSDAVRAEYRAAHPLLRLALSTWILADGDLVVTDLARRPADYAGMGLPANEATLHARQADGWAHAVDLRTAGRGFVTTVLVRAYFRAMGFRTRRHGGTADHLHVSLPSGN